jgi:hypothetical protein
MIQLMVIDIQLFYFLTRIISENNNVFNRIRDEQIRNCTYM